MAAKKKPKLEKSALEDASELMAEQGFLNKYDLRAGERCVATGRFVGRRNSNTKGDSLLYVADEGDDEARSISEDEASYGTPSISPDGRYAIANVGAPSPGVVEFDIENGGASTRVWEGNAPNGAAITQAVYCGEAHVALFTGTQLNLMKRNGPATPLEHASTLGTQKALKGLTVKRAHEGRALVLVHQSRTTVVGLTSPDELEVIAEMPMTKGSFATMNDRVVQRDAATGEVFDITNLDELLSF
jgi:hypothetical protein